MIRVYLSPRFYVEPNHTRNILAQFAHFPETFDEIVNTSRMFGVCCLNAGQVTHDAVVVDGRAVPLSLMYANKAALVADLSVPFGDFDPVLRANARAALEAAGIDTDWILSSHTLRDVLRHLVRSISIIQILTGEHKADVIHFLKGNLNSTVGEVPVQVRVAVRDWMDSKTLDRSWITNTTTVREVIRYIANNLQFERISLAGEDF